MNIKFNQLSIIGKIWTIAEMFYAGIRDDKNSYIVATFRHLEELSKDEETLMSKAVLFGSIEQLIENAKTEKQLMLGESETGALTTDGGSIIETIWFDRIELDDIKRRVKNDSMLKDDLTSLEEIYSEIKHIWTKDLKEKQLSSKERRDLFKIKEEIEDFKIKIEKRVERNQITVI